MFSIIETALITWAVGKGLPVGGDEAGFWLNYQREENTTQTASNATQQDQKTVRNRNRSLFKAGDIDSDQSMPEYLWRSDWQPNGRGADEKCVAQKSPSVGGDWMLGVDDYNCNGSQLHYVICQFSDL
ncbi:uncharacterized protein LOC142357481 [Convolutriloba macropyga]|uniref:uncharacterized protein LOC142357481 n=1 Tax=Convolutriloba macropyga TaxID=536237 RepID=UPI003F51B4E3